MICTDKEAAVRGFGRPLDRGLRIGAACFNTLIGEPVMSEGLCRFNKRDHPGGRRGTASTTTGIARPRAIPCEEQ